MLPRRHSALFFAALLLLAAPRLSFAQSQTSASSTPILSSGYGEKIQISGVGNAGKINSALFRGNQPKSSAFPELKKLGITTIVDLRGEDHGKMEWERKQAESLGLRFVNIPVSGWSPPTNEQVAQFLSIFHDDPKQKVFVHCRFGDDRTGVFVAAYRMAIDHWPAEQALREMYFFGFNGFWHPAMKSFIHEFPARLSTAPAFAGYAKPQSPAEGTTH